MACARGCCATQAEHYRSIAVTPAPLGREEERRLGDYLRARDAGLQPPDIDRGGKMLRAVGG